MATLMSISENVDSQDDVVTQQPISDTSVNHESRKQSLTNGKILTADLDVGAITTDNVIFKLTDETIRTEARVQNAGKKRLSSQSSTQSEGARRKDKKSGILKKMVSAPSLSSANLPGVYNFDNPAFESDVDTAHMSFSDVVTKLISPPIKEDIHPYGRGHLYRSAFDSEQPKIHQDEGKLLGWAVATLVLFGLAASVIFMSFMYTPPITAADTTNQTILFNTTIAPK